MIVVDIALNFSRLFGERLEIRFHQPDMDGVAILPSDRELVSRIGLLEPCPYQCHDFRRMLPLVIAAFPAVFVIHILAHGRVMLEIRFVFISCRGHGNVRPVLPDLEEPFKLGVHLLHDRSVATLVRVVLQCQPAVFFLQVRQRVYVLKISHSHEFFMPLRGG